MIVVSLSEIPFTVPWSVWLTPVSRSSDVCLSYGVEKPVTPMYFDLTVYAVSSFEGYELCQVV